MDTLSRKHRLRQHQERRQQIQQQQQVLYGKENHRGQNSFEDYQLDCNATVHSNNNNNLIYANNNNYKINNNGREDDEEEEFKVFQVVEIRKGLNADDQHHQQKQHQYIGKLIENKPPPRSSKTAPPPAAAKATTNGGGKLNKIGLARRRQLKTSEEEEDGEEGDGAELHYDEEHVIGEHFSIVCTASNRQEANQRVYLKQQQQQQVVGNTLTKGPVYATNHCSTDTARSTGDSSGFLSEGSGGTHQSSRSKSGHNTGAGLNDNYHKMAKTQKQQQQQQQSVDQLHPQRPTRSLRSKVIEDLGHMMADVLSRSSASPTESYLSCADSTLTRGRELDYSTLCRDEFSSFIAVESKLNGHQKSRYLAEQQQDHELGMGRPPEPRRRQSAAVAATPTGNKSRLERDAGPVLVGVHDSDGRVKQPNQYHRYGNPQYSHATSSSSGSSDTDPFEGSTQDEIRSSSSCLSTTSRSSHYEQSLERELMMCANGDCNAALMSPEDVGQFEVEPELLDIFVNRVDAIRRLAEGDKSVTLEDLFGSDDNAIGEIQVSEENRTAIEFAPLARDESIRVIQEIEMIEMPIDCRVEDLNEMDSNQVGALNCVVATNVIDGDFRSKLSSSEPVCPQLDWPPAEQVAAAAERLQVEQNTNNPESLSKLEELLLSRLLDNNKQQQANASSSQISYHHHQKPSQHLVKTVRRHLSEFIENYVMFQRELRSTTSYANDWHQNWLFAYKRPNDDNGRLAAGNHDAYDGGDLHETSPKRAKMSLVGGDDGQAEQLIEPLQPPSRIRLEPNESDHPIEDDKVNDHLEQPPVDLIRYSTLILSQCSAIKLNYRLRPEQCEELLNGSERFHSDIDKSYCAQEDKLRELYSISQESSCQIDVCRLMLMDSFEESDAGDSQRIKRRQRDRRIASNRASRLVINYSSSLVPKCDNIYRFNTFGYLFEVPISTITAKPKRLALIRRRVLAKTLEVSIRGDVEAGGSCEREQQVRFLVNLTNVELVNDLPVIQFCAKVGGALPICVSWFSGGNGQDLCDISSCEGRNSLKVRQSCLSPGANREDPSWPIGMHGSYDYEYRNKWGSWYRFRRSQGDLLFEIRDANLDADYNKTFRCVVQNHCSRKECTFTLRRRQLASPQRSWGERKLDPNANESDEAACVRRKLAPVKRAPSGSGEARDGHALLRTWSQRTMPRPQPQSSGATAERQNQSTPLTIGANANEFNGVAGNGGDPGSGGWNPPTIGRRSLGTVEEAGAKFGQDFPYHPENLLKRLNENKFLVKSNQKLSHLQQQHQLLGANGFEASRSTNGQDDGATLQSSNSRVQFTDSFELFTGNEADEEICHNHRSGLTIDQSEPQIERRPDDGANLGGSTAGRHSKRETTVGHKEAVYRRSESTCNQAQAHATGVDQLDPVSPLPEDGKLAAAPKPMQRLRPAAGQMEAAEEDSTLDCGPIESQLSSRFDGHSKRQALGAKHGLSPGSQTIIKSRQSDQKQQQAPANGRPMVETAATKAFKTPAATASQTRVVAPTILASQQTALAPAVMGQVASLGKQRGAASELDRSSNSKQLEECKTRTNVKSLISRFSLA